MRKTARVSLAAMAVGASFAFSTPSAFAQAACEYPFDCPTGGGGGLDGTTGGAGTAGGGSTVGGGSALPVTGGELVLLTMTGAGALAAGTALVVAGRRRGATA